MDKNITIDRQLVEALVTCLIQQKDFNPMQTDEQKQLQRTTEHLLNAAVTILSAQIATRVAANNPVGQHGIDPSKSSFV